jgi:hypothetical protein
MMMKWILFLTVLLSVMGCDDSQNMRACGSMCGSLGVA